MAGGTEQWDITTSVGLTALGVAAARAVESERPDALVRDPYAAHFVEAATDAPTTLPTGRGDPAADSPLWRALADFLAIRSRFLDDLVRESVGAGIAQVVLLAAGLDVRAHRLDALAGRSVWEVDQPAVLAFKDDVLDRAGAVTHADRHRVAADLRDDWPTALAAAGHDRSRPTLWLAEGLLPYLPAAAESDLLGWITELSAPGSRAGIELVRDIDAVLDSDALSSSGEELGADLASLWDREPRRPADEVLWQRGWTTRTETAAKAADRFGRALDADVASSLGRNGVLLSARLE